MALKRYCEIYYYKYLKVLWGNVFRLQSLGTPEGTIFNDAVTKMLTVSVNFYRGIQCSYGYGHLTLDQSKFQRGQAA